MKETDIPGLSAFVEMVGDTDCGLYACKASVNLFRLGKNDLDGQMEDIITVGELG